MSGVNHSFDFHCVARIEVGAVVRHGEPGLVFAVRQIRLHPADGAEPLVISIYTGSDAQELPVAVAGEP